MNLVEFDPETFKFNQKSFEMEQNWSKSIQNDKINIFKLLIDIFNENWTNLIENWSKSIFYFIFLKN